MSCLGDNHKSMGTIPKSLDEAMDKGNPSGDHVEPGISIRNGPMVEMDIEEHSSKPLQANGAATTKRKARQSNGTGKSYNEVSNEDDDDDQPLVRQWNHSLWGTRLALLTLCRVSGVVPRKQRLK